MTQTQRERSSQAAKDLCFIGRDDLIFAKRYCRVR